jgi:hypothetical protein
MATTRRFLGVSTRPAAKTKPRGDINRSGSNRDEIAWACIPGLYAVGYLANWGLTQYGSLGLWLLTLGCMAAATGLVGWRLWLMTNPRDRHAREDISTTFTAAGVGVMGTTLFARSLVWAVPYAVFAVAVVLVYVARESRRVKGDGRDDRPAGVDMTSLGLAEGTVIKPDPKDMQTLHVQHADGQDTSHVRVILAALESRAKLAPGSLMARVGRHRGHTIIQRVDTTTLDGPVPWPGPSRPGGSIAEPLRVGKWADGDPVESTWREHSLTMGVTGSGKTSSGALVKVTEMLTRRDVVILWCDPIKGVQSAGPVAPGVAWAATTEPEARAMVAALIRSIPARTAALAALRDAKHPKKGYTKWEPDAHAIHGIPAVYVQFEEASWLVDHGALVKVAERARSAGIWFDMSLQRAQNERMDTNVRSQLTRRICFGVMDADDAGFCLGTRVLEAGASPESWEDRQPGMSIMQARDVPDRKAAMPMRWFMATRDGKAEDLTVLEEVVTGHVHVRAHLDDVTTQAFGPAYQAWLQARDSDPDLAVARPVPTSSPGHEEVDLSGVDDLDTEPIDGDEDPMPLPVTEGVDLTGIDPGADDQDTSADDVDLGDLTGSRLSTEERNERFRRMLADRWARGLTVVSQTELSNEWHEVEGGGGKPWPYMRLNRLARIGGPGGSPLVARDEQEPSLWHVNSDPAEWTPEAVTVTGSDVPQPGDDD